MANTEKQAVENLIKGVIRAIDERINNISFTKYYRSEIVSILDGGEYVVNIDNQEYTTYSTTDMTFKIRDKVWVVAPNGNFSKKFICGIRK